MRKDFTRRPVKTELGIIFFTITFVILAINSVYTYVNAKRLYSTAMEVTGLDYEDDLVIVTDANGFEWSFYGIEDLFEGDIVSVILNDNGTDIVLDDTIISAQYSGYVKN